MTELMDKFLVETVKGIEIYFTPLVEDSPPEDDMDFETEEEKNEYFDKLNRHIIQRFCAKVHAEINGVELSSDYLGCCCYDKFEDFYTEYKADYYSDMKATVIKEAKENIKTINAIIKKGKNEASNIA